MQTGLLHGMIFTGEHGIDQVESDVDDDRLAIEGLRVNTHNPLAKKP